MGTARPHGRSPVDIVESSTEASDWSKDSPLNHPDDWSEVRPEDASQRALKHILAVRLEAKTIDRLAEIGRKMGIGPSTLARMWLLERLDKEGVAQ